MITTKHQYKKVATWDIFETKEYDMFKFLVNNRDINEKQVMHIVKSIEKEEVLNPIKVTPDFYILDGQHTLLAYKYLNRPVKFIISEDFNAEQIMRYNIHRQWREADFVKCYAKLGNDEYIKLLEFKKMYPEFKHLRVYINLCILKQTSGITAGGESIIKDGLFKIKEWGRTIELADKMMDYVFLKDYKNRAWGQYGFFTALYKLITNKKYNHNWGVSHIQKYPRMLVRNINEIEYLKNLIEVYNYQIRKNPRISLDDFTFKKKGEY